MGDKTEIQWTDSTWNPIRGCSRVSPGCGGAHGEGGCYAERQAARFSGPGLPYEGLVRIGKQGPRWTGNVRLVTSKLADPLGWKKPAKIFVNSMSDLFHEGFSNEEIASVFGVMAACPQHTFQVLTKRAKRMREWFEWVDDRALSARSFPVGLCQALASQILRRADFMPELVADWPPWPLPNVWLGVSCEDQQRADERIPELLKTPAAVRFVSYEPALGPVRFHDSWMRDDVHPGLDWVIVGGESGPGARPFDIQWARGVVAQCKEANVACFVKQLGARPIAKGSLQMHRFSETSVGASITTAVLNLRDRKGGDMAEWPEDIRVREMPAGTAP